MLAQPVLLSLLTHTFQREKPHANVQEWGCQSQKLSKECWILHYFECVHQGGKLLEVSWPVRPLTSLSYLVNLCGKVLDCCDYFFCCVWCWIHPLIFGWKWRPKDGCREVTALKESCHSWDKLMMTLQGGDFTDSAEEIFISWKSEKPGMTCVRVEIHLLQKLKNPVRAAIFQYSSACLCKQPDQTLTSSLGRFIFYGRKQKDSLEHLSLKVTGWKWPEYSHSSVLINIHKHLY